MAGIRIEGNTSGNVVEVTGSNQLKVIPETSVSNNPQNVGAIRFFSENDPGDMLGTPYLVSPETDDDFRLRTSNDTLLDVETFNYATGQNTGKHTYANTTITATWTTAGLTTNGSNVTTTGTGLTVGTYAEFPLLGTSHIYAEFEASLTAQPTTNFIIDFGMFRRGGSTAYAPTDGTYFRLNASGWQGVVNYNGAETTTNLNFTYSDNQKYQFILVISERSVEFWIDNVLYGEIPTPAGQGQPFLSSTLPLSLRHTHTGTTAGVINFVLNDYNITLGGSPFSRTLGEASNGALGSYQGLSGGTMGSLATYPNSSNPTAAAPGNTSLTANLPAGLGGQGAITAAAAAATDGIWGSYQVPAGTVSIQGKRLRITGISVDAVNAGAAVATTATTVQLSLSFGSTGVSLATTEGAAAKAPRRIALGFMTWAVGAAIGAGPQSGPIRVDLTQSPIYVNPGEYIQLVGKFLVGTATASQVINFVWQPIYSWE